MVVRNGFVAFKGIRCLQLKCKRISDMDSVYPRVWHLVSAPDYPFT